ncbi:ommochrome-binding protein-like [Vanessa cardui]|uniref:ommochrome-binding protein-like n=1 Tax=Vanessa cardui TaxID=171605 RepID=UPI001F137077|nr:ommochrome-binding protein-like [Vanessa cardui]
MIVVLLLFFISIASAEENGTVCNSCIKVNTTCYNVSYLFDIEAPFRNRIVISKLGILRSTNTLFFSFEPNIDDKEYYKVGFVNLDNPVNISVISGEKQIMNFGTFDLDQDNELVYLGGSDGIYVLDTKVNRVAPYSSRGDIIISLFYKGNVYFIRYGEFKIIRKKGDNFVVLFEMMQVKNFVSNKYDVSVLLCGYGLFASKKDEMVWLSKNSYFRGLTIDLDNNIYAWWIDGIYKVIIEPKLADSRIVRIAHIPSIGALTFDNDNNFLFTVGKSLFRLIELSNTTIC